MKNKLLFSFIALVGIFGATLFVANASSAAGLFGIGHGGEQKLPPHVAGYRQQLEMQNEAVEATAEILGTDVESLEQELETKDLPEILADNGVTQDEFQARMQEQMREMLKAKGFTDEQIDERVAQHDQRHQAMLENQAKILGMNAEELEQALEDQSFPELLDEAGVTHVELHDQMREFKGEFGPGFGLGPRGGFDKT